VNRGIGGTFFTDARRSTDSRRMYSQPMSSSYHLLDNFAAEANAW